MTMLCESSVRKNIGWMVTDICVIEHAKYCEKQRVVNCMPLVACMPVMVMLLMLMVTG